MSNSESEFFVLTTDTVQGYEGEIVRFPIPVSGYGSDYHEREDAYKKATESLIVSARKMGANAVIGARYEMSAKTSYHVYATGTPVFMDPPLQDPKEYIENLQDSLEAGS